MGAVRALVIVEVDPSRLQELSLSDTRQQVKPDSSADVDVGRAVYSLCECRQLLRPHLPLALALGKLVDAIGGEWFRWIGAPVVLVALLPSKQQKLSIRALLVLIPKSVACHQEFRRRHIHKNHRTL